MLGTPTPGTADTPAGASQPPPRNTTHPPVPWSGYRHQKSPAVPPPQRSPTSTSPTAERLLAPKSPAFIRRDRKPKKRTYPGGVDARHMPAPGTADTLVGASMPP